MSRPVTAVTCGLTQWRLARQRPNVSEQRGATWPFLFRFSTRLKSAYANVICGTGEKGGMSGNREKIVAEIITNALSGAMRDAPSPSLSLLPPEKHRARARLLRELDPNSRAAELHDLAARAFERRQAERAYPPVSPLENGVSGISTVSATAKIVDDVRIFPVRPTTKSRRFWTDDKLILAAIFLMAVCPTAWPLLVLWVVVFVGFRGVEKFGRLLRKKRRHFIRIDALKQRPWGRPPRRRTARTVIVPVTKHLRLTRGTRVKPCREFESHSSPPIC